MTARKQPGRRFGPAPKNPPHERMQAPKPMTSDERLDAYDRAAPGSTFTRRQKRQIDRMENRALRRYLDGTNR